MDILISKMSWGHLSEWDVLVMGDVLVSRDIPGNGMSWEHCGRCPGDIPMSRMSW